MPKRKVHREDNLVSEEGKIRCKRTANHLGKLVECGGKMGRKGDSQVAFIRSKKARGRGGCQGTMKVEGGGNGTRRDVFAHQLPGGEGKRHRAGQKNPGWEERVSFFL